MIHLNRYNKVCITETVKGNLDINVYDITNNNPIGNAIINVFKTSVIGQYGERGEGVLVCRYITDNNGKIPIISLPVINNYDTLIRRSREFYFLIVNAFGYYDVVVMEIKIYPNITTSYNIKLSPITTQTPKYEFIFNPVIV